MKNRLLVSWICLGALVQWTQAAVLTVTTTNNVSPAASETSLWQALSRVQDNDEVRFNIPGPGPHYIATPPQGYPLITNQNIFINGYSQPGSTPNANPILATNGAKLQIVLDSRDGGYRSMTIPLISPNDDPGFESSEGTVLGVAEAKGFKVQGVSFLGVPQVGTEGNINLNFVALARGASGHVRGCWLGVDPDGQTVAGAARGIVGRQYQAKDAVGEVTNTFLINDLVIGVESGATNPPEQFNVIVGMPANPILVEGDNTRISGNFITVLPDGMHDYDVALISEFQGRFQGAISVGRGGNNTLIGTDGDGLNDDQERNVLGGMLPPDLGGYDHLIDFYSLTPGTNIVIAGNYVGVGIDGQTRFTNGVPVLNASGVGAQYRLGSNLDNLSDAAEGNIIANNYPAELFPASGFQQAPESLNFLSQLTVSGAVSLRGNSLINNFPFPTSPTRGEGAFWVDYYAQVLVDPSAGVSPVLDTNSTVTRLKGTVPFANTDLYTRTVVDLYLADPSGITNGMAAHIPQLPQGFVQGITYKRSFVENSTVDKNAQRGAFEFDITSLGLPAGTLVTVTANYIAPEGVVETPGLQGITLTSDGVLITWTGDGILQSAASVTGPWADEATTGDSLLVPPTEAAQFYRMQAGESNATAGGPPLTSPFSNAIQLR